MKPYQIILCLLLFFIFINSGCIFDNENDNVPDGDASNLQLSINTDREQYNLSVVDDLIITFELKNIGREKVKVEKRFDLGANLKLYLFDEKNQTINVVVESSTHTIKEEQLNPNSKKQYEING